jgi:hypothetical protein
MGEELACFGDLTALWRWIGRIEPRLSKTIVGMIYGAIIARIALLIIAKVRVPGLGTVWPAIVV